MAAPVSQWQKAVEVVTYLLVGGIFLAMLGMFVAGVVRALRRR